MCAQRVKTGKGGRGSARTVAKVGKVAAAAGLAPALTIAATPQPSGASVIDTKAAWQSAQWPGAASRQPGVHVLASLKCTSVAGSNGHSYARAKVRNYKQYGISDSMHWRPSAKVKDWSNHQFVTQEMWEETTSKGGPGGGSTWIEAGEFLGYMDQIYSWPGGGGSMPHSGWYWADERSKSFWDHLMNSVTTRGSYVYHNYIMPTSTKSKWAIEFKSVSPHGKSTYHNQTGSGELKNSGIGAFFGIENTCVSNTWHHNAQTMGRKMKNGSKYSWSAFSPSRLSSKVTGKDVWFSWVKNSSGAPMVGYKFSAGT